MSTPDQRIGSWLRDLGSASPTPGGGAAAGVAAATGAALIAMVGHLTIGKKGFEDLEARMRSMVETADREREAFLALADEDARAFESVMTSFKLPKQTDEEKNARTLRIQETYEAAAAVPLDLAKRSVDLMELAEDATAIGNAHAAS
ncbi:MAG TPA: cyclodeaminase/cyclohydrolase family protein, partial [Actinomycetota bacterium]|nr:cyclodeaminase/cyclohydrolase family protein [Actinomycetota bacterium]